MSQEILRPMRHARGAKWGVRSRRIRVGTARAVRKWRSVGTLIQVTDVFSSLCRRNLVLVSTAR